VSFWLGEPCNLPQSQPDVVVSILTAIRGMIMPVEARRVPVEACQTLNSRNSQFSLLATERLSD